MKRTLAITLGCAIAITGCSTKFNTKADYSFSESELGRGKIFLAIRALPDGEKWTFITTMERTYLNLLRGNPDISGLLWYARKIEERLRYSVSRELKSFFYLETPEGYYASEHEIIWMHILLSWGFSMRGNFEKAYVEAKKSSVLLSTNWSQEGRFDDPFLRIVLGCIWAMCGHWEEAQVDFRVAASLRPKLKWIRELAEMEKAPGDLVMILGGPGPVPVWKPRLEEKLFRGFRGIVFRGRGIKSSLGMIDSSGVRRRLLMTPDSSPWYVRHFVRDNSIQEYIEDSKYGQRLLVSSVKNVGRATLGVVGGVVIAVGGIAVGGAVMVVGLYAESAEIFALGFVPVGYGVVKGYDVASGSVKASARDMKNTADVSNRYRFVRFLSEYAWIGWSRKKLNYPLKVYKNKKEVLRVELEKTQKGRVTQVSTGFYPDVR
jgi:hypothetical protein